MERSRKIFLDIRSAAQRVITSATEYANHKNQYRIQGSHFQLEHEMKRISAACKCIASILEEESMLQDGPAFDVRLKDWLATDEPQQCLDTLTQIQTLLQKDESSWVSRFFRRGRGTASTEDKIKEVAEYFGSRKAYFHFMLSREIW